MKPTSVRIDEPTLQGIDSIAQSLGRSRAWVIQDALNKYLEYEAWFRAEVRLGLDEAETGRVVSHEEVRNRIKGLGIDLD